jgi:hypothetical protein
MSKSKRLCLSKKEELVVTQMRLGMIITYAVVNTTPYGASRGVHVFPVAAAMT